MNPFPSLGEESSTIAARGGRARLAARAPTSGLVFCRAAADAPTAAGAYVLIIRIDEPVGVTIAGKPAGTLRPGRYLYCGSAKGPGGLRARLSRHMRRRKSVRWHVDQLTSRGRVRGAWVAVDGDECDLVAALSHLPVPIPAFGSTDCARCGSHLLAWPEPSPRR